MFEIIVTVSLLIFIAVREFLNDRNVQRLNTSLQEANKVAMKAMEDKKNLEDQFKRIVAEKDQVIVDLQRITPSLPNDIGESSDEGLLDEFNITNVKKVMVDGKEQKIKLYA